MTQRSVGSAHLRSRLRGYVPWVLASAGATVAAAALQSRGTTDFERFMGPLPPALTVATAGVVGAGALWLLEGRGFWRATSRSRMARGLAIASVATLPFAAVAIGVDALVGFPRDTNLAWPGAWLFYPTIALVAETAFRLLPLAGLVWMTRTRFVGRALDGRTWALVLATATVEPAAQLALGSALPAFVVPHVYVFGVIQLLLFRRYGYLPMLWFRVCYYLIWHVLWGGARLELLF